MTVKLLLAETGAMWGALLVLSFLSVECHEFRKKSTTTSWDRIREQRIPAALESPTEPLGVVEAHCKGE